MSETQTMADSVGAQVTQILDEATVAAAELLAQADHEADRAGRDELANLRDSLEERIEAIRSARARLTELGDGTAARLRASAAQLAEMPVRLSVNAQDSAGSSFFDRAYSEAEATRDDPRSHLAALVKAADKIAEELAEGARKQARQLEHAARREADRIGLEEPKRVERAYDPTARRAEALRREVEALNRLLDQEVTGADQEKERTEDETGPKERRPAGLRGRKQRR